MAVSNVEVSTNELYVYKLSQRVVDSLELLYFDSLTIELVPSELPITAQALKANEEKLQLKEIKESQLKGCKTCQWEEEDLETVRDHFKSDFHRFNMKRMMNSLPPVSEPEFEKLIEDLDESISGSESTDSEDQEPLQTIYEKSTQSLADISLEDQGTISYMNTKSPFILFKSGLLPSSSCFGIFKSQFNFEATKLDPLQQLKSWNATDQSTKYSALLMIGGGHFAGAIISHKPKNVKGNTGSAQTLLEQSVDVLEHKTFHRYTTRRKQGGSQSASDNARGKAKSAGSSLRRYNEAALEKEVRELLASWKKYLVNCDSIFVRANGSANRNILIGYEDAVLKNGDPRIKSFPFTTKRATATELKKAWVSLSYLKVMDIPKSDEKLRQRLLKQQESLANSLKSQGKPSDEKSEDEKVSQELISLIKKSRAPALMSYIKKNNIPSDFKLQPESEFMSTPTLLHYAAANGHTHMTQVLMINIKCDPCLKNHLGKTPCDVSSSRQVKQIFQVSRHNLGEDFCDWESAHVGQPKSKEEIQRQETDAKLEEENAKKTLIEKELAKHKEETAQEREKKFGPARNLGIITSIPTNMTELSDLQKARLMREQRARAAEERMKRMQQQ